MSTSILRTVTNTPIYIRRKSNFAEKEKKTNEASRSRKTSLNTLQNNSKNSNKFGQISKRDLRSSEYHAETTFEKFMKPISASNNIKSEETSIYKKNISEENSLLKISEQNDVSKGKINIHENLDLKLSNKDLLKKYGRKEEYVYFGIKFKAPLKFLNIVTLTLLHFAGIYGVYIQFSDGFSEKLIKNLIWGSFLAVVAGFGITAGAHRYWTHRSYKANLPMRILLAICYSVGGENPIPEWVRDHRVHHKYSETDADPHNSNRGFFFAHVGWLMMKKHPAVLERGKSVDMSDILNDPLIKFHTKYFVPLKILFCFLLPSIVPVYFWNEGWLYTFYVQCVIRYTCSLNFTWSVNSLAHLYGKRPYDQRINPVENRFVAFIAMGEGWHNYHHVFPWDYKAAELAYTINITTMWIDLFAKLGWAYDRKQPSLELVKTISVKHGDGSHSEWGHKEIPDPYHGSQNNSNDNSHKTSERILNEKLL